MKKAILIFGLALLVSVAFGQNRLRFGLTVGDYPNAYSETFRMDSIVKTGTDFKVYNGATQLNPDVPVANRVDLTSIIQNSEKQKLYRGLYNQSLMLPFAGTSSGSSGIALSGGFEYFALYYTDVPQLIDSVSWQQPVVGDYTGNITKYSGIVLYSLSGTTITRIDSTASDTACWKTGSANDIRTKPLVVKATLQPGYYVVGIMYNRTAQTTAPTVSYDVISKLVSTMTLRNGMKVSSYIGSLTWSKDVYNLTAATYGSAVYLIILH